MPNDKLTDKMEHYCQLRANGFNKTKAASAAYDTNNPGKVGPELEQKEKIKARIQQLKEERMEIAGVTIDEQLRKYHDIYQMATLEGNLKLAMEVLGKIDALSGFDVKRSEVTRKDAGDSLKDKGGDVSKDLERFPSLLGKHSDDTSSVN